VRGNVAYLKSLGVGILALVVYLVIVPVMWVSVPLLGGWLKARLISSRTAEGGFRGFVYVGGGSFHLTSPLL
jgi:hypothetical protein